MIDISFYKVTNKLILCRERYHPIARKMLETDLRKLNELERQQKAAEIVETTTPDVDNGSQSTVFVDLQENSVEPEADGSVIVEEAVSKETPKEAVVEEEPAPKEEEKPREEPVAPALTNETPSKVDNPAVSDPLWEKARPADVVIPQEDFTVKRQEEKRAAPTRSQPNPVKNDSEVSLFQNPMFWFATGIAVLSIFAFRRFRR